MTVKIKSHHYEVKAIASARAVKIASYCGAESVESSSPVPVRSYNLSSTLHAID